MDIRLIKDQMAWDAFVLAQPDYTFLQSWAWGDFNRSTGNKVWRLGMFDGDELCGVALVILVAARRGRFLFVPHGPIFAEGKNREIPNSKFQKTNDIEIQNLKFKNFIDYLKKIAKDEHCSFIRISSLLLKTPENESLFRAAGFKRAPIHMHAETTWLLNITRSGDEILAGMRKAARYLVRRSQKDNVEIISGASGELLSDFYTLYKRTAARQGFVPFSFDYISAEAAAFGRRDARIYLAKRNGEVLAGALIIFYGERAFYHHGASVHHPNASYALQWRIIMESKERGVKEYNFWGVDFRPGHPWRGVTLFKTGFGGSSRSYVPAQDLPLNRFYWTSFIIDTLRRITRRY